MQGKNLGSAAESSELVREPTLNIPDLATGETMAATPANLATAQTMAASGPSGTPHAASSALPGRAPFRRGDSLGRFIILDTLGAGGMGVVLAAYDPDLDRKVAIKLLRAAGSDGGTGEARKRLVREAQAIAKISHPNVVTVHEVGAVGEHLFVAMELVPGGTLRSWLAAEKRSKQAILAMFLQAGRGLAAAHRAGLVHRDFKPENVLISEDGRARVTDFGLVSVAGQAAEPAPSGEAEPDAAMPDAGRPDTAMPDAAAIDTGRRLGLSASTPLHLSLTRTGSVLGTPRYMAPEQFRGQPADARADQFSFCVALFEALYGEPPFAGQTYTELVHSVLAGEVVVPRCADVPLRLRRILVRGLAARPEDRHPSMSALLGELEAAGRGSGRRVVMGAAAALVIVAGAAMLLATRTDSEEICRGADHKLVGIWDEARKAALTAALTSDEPHAAATLARVASTLDDYSRRWAVMYTDTCEATHVRHEQSEALLDLRMHCLDRRLGEMRSLVDAMMTGDSALDRAAQAAADLTGLERCADADSLRAVVPLPADDAGRRKVAELESGLARAGASHKLGHYEAALADSLTIVKEADALGYAPLQAEALTLAAALHIELDRHRGDTHINRALTAAVASGDDALLVRVLRLRIYVLGALEGQYQAANELVVLTEAMAEHTELDAATRARLLATTGRVHEDQERYAEALDRYHRALAALDAAPTHDELLAARIHLYVGNARWRKGEYAQALEHYQKTLTVETQVLGPEHPEVGSAHFSIGTVLMYMNRFAESREHLLRALELREKGLGPGHALVGDVLQSLADLAASSGDVEAAVDYARRTLEIWRETHGPDTLSEAMALFTLGNALRARGALEEATRHLERAVAIYPGVLDPTHSFVLSGRSELASTLAEHGKLEEARALLERAVAVAVEAHGPEHRELVLPLSHLGDVLRRQGRHREAEDRQRRALVLAEKAAGEEPLFMGFVRHRLGELYLDMGRESEARLELEQARTVFEGVVGPDHFYVALSLIVLGKLHARAGRREAALAALERALTICGTPRGSPQLRARARFELAKVLWTQAGDRGRARDLASQAHTDLAATDLTIETAEVAAWLAARR